MVKQKVRNIVILGAGFAGIRIAQDLPKMIAKSGFKIFLVDKNDTHVFHADMYEVACAFNKKITEQCLTKLRETVATPIEKLIDNKRVTFIRNEILAIDGEKKLVHLKHGEDLNYDYLVVCLGSVSNYFGIPGLKENCFELKTLQDAMAINCHLDQYFKVLSDSGKKKVVNITVGGGGATGVELVCELVGYIKCLCKKYRYPYAKVRVQLIEGTDKLVGLPKKGTEIVLKRFRKLGIITYLETFITRVTEKEISLKYADGQTGKIANSFLVWTGGVMVSSVVSESLGSAQARGAIMVNPYLQSFHDRNVFAAGDNAFFVGMDGKPLPMLAATAFSEGRLVTENLARLINGQFLKPYRPSFHGVLVPLGGKCALYKKGDLILTGFMMWVLKRLVFFFYNWTILPFDKALRKTFRSTKIFVENDSDN